jgi:hypothetical protein
MLRRDGSLIRHSCSSATNGFRQILKTRSEHGRKQKLYCAAHVCWRPLIQKEGRVLSQPIAVTVFGEKARYSEIVAENPQPALARLTSFSQRLSRSVAFSYGCENIQLHGSLDCLGALVSIDRLEEKNR